MDSHPATTLQTEEKLSNKQSLLNTVDHTWLPEWPFSGEFNLKDFCKHAESWGVAGVCVRLPYVAQAKSLLSASPAIHISTVIGFPATKVTIESERRVPSIGDIALSTKLQDIAEAKAAGATELDIVWNTRLFLSGWAQQHTQDTQDELAALMEAANEGSPTPVKLIIETDTLPTEALEHATQLCANAGVAMVKTCTGYVMGGQGATVPIVECIRTTLNRMTPQHIGIKASGGIKTPEQAQALLEAGATRLGLSQTQVLC